MIKYKIQFSNRINEDYIIDLNHKYYSGDYTSLTGTAEVLTIKSISNDDDRFSPILSKEVDLSIWIHEKQGVDITNFLSTEDDEWRVTIYREKEAPPIFDGFMVVEDSSQPLLDAPFPLNIRASDGLALLKNVELVRADGTDFIKLNNLTDYIGHILYYVNPDIPFRVYSDIYHKAMDETICPLEQTQVDAMSFEKNETTFEDCYTVIETIMQDSSCRLFYENGYWHVLSIGQYQNVGGFNWHEYKVENGEVKHQGTLNNEILISKIGKTEVIQAINKDAIIYYKVASKSVKKTFNYEIPKEIICNQQLLRGEEIPGLAAPVVYNTNGTIKEYAFQGYELECWTHHRNGGLAGEGIPTTKTAYIRREFDQYHYEKDRYIVLPTEANNAGSTQLRTDTFYVGTSDKLNISVETRLKNGYSGSQGVIWMYILLRGDNGVNYTYGPFGSDPTNKWRVATSNFNAGFTQVEHQFNNTDDKTQWSTFSVETAPIPVDGNVQLVFMEYSQGGYPNETHYKSINIEYLPYVKNSYRPASGDFNIYGQNLKINRTIDETVSISDSPKKIIKGALFVNNLLATPEWRRKGRTESLRFMQMMALLKYNFHFRQFRKVEGTLKGLSLFNGSDENIPFGFLPQYSLTDVPASPKFILTSITDCNYYESQWRGVIVEIPAEDPDFDTYDFQYIFQ